MNDTLGATIAEKERKKRKKKISSTRDTWRILFGSGEYRGAEEKHQFPPEKNLGDAIP